MSRVRVGVVRGGRGGEYEVSLNTGSCVLRHLPEEKYEANDILLARDGTWHMDGFPVSPTNLRNRVDVIFNALHGEYGEDGGAQRFFDSLMIPYTGSTAFPSAIGMNKVLSRETFRQLGLKIPFGQVYSSAFGSPEEIAHAAWNRVPCPWVVKPANGGSSVGVSIAKNFSSLVTSVENALRHGATIIVEEMIKGREATAGVVDYFRGDTHYVLPPIQIVKPSDRDFFDYDAKYTGISKEICPGHFTPEETDTVRDLALRAHRGLGLRHYSRSDFIVSPRGVYILETNTLPGLTTESLLPKALDAVGCSYPQFLDHILTLALMR